MKGCLSDSVDNVSLPSGRGVDISFEANITFCGHDVIGSDLDEVVVIENGISIALETFEKKDRDFIDNLVDEYINDHSYDAFEDALGNAADRAYDLWRDG